MTPSVPSSSAAQPTPVSPSNRCPPGQPGTSDGQVLVVPPLTKRNCDPALFQVDCVATSALCPETGWPEGL